MRAKIPQVSLEFIVSMCQPRPFRGWCLKSHGLPADAEVVSLSFMLPTTINITQVSKEWPDVAGDKPLEHVEPPVFEQIPAQDISNPWARSAQ